MRYFSNLRLWLTGFRQLGTIAYKPGWNPWKFFPVYLLDCGLNVLTGGAVCRDSWPDWFWLRDR